MSALALAALSLVSASPDLASVRQPVSFAAPRALADDDLDRVRGARGVAFSGGRGALPRLARDPVMRELAIPRSLMEQQFDNWFNDVGAQLIVANLTR